MPGPVSRIQCLMICLIILLQETAMWCAVYSTSKLATAIRSIATNFLVYDLFAHSLTPPTAERCPQAAVILEF